MGLLEPCEYWSGTALETDPELNGFFVDALFPRTSEIWWLVLGCTRAPRGLNPWNQGALKQTQPVDAREGDTW